MDELILNNQDSVISLSLLKTIFVNILVIYFLLYILEIYFQKTNQNLFKLGKRKINIRLYEDGHSGGDLLIDDINSNIRKELIKI